MTGLILCGGQSSRMGSDKGLLELNEKSWVQIAIDKLKDFHIPVVISVNKNQFQNYASVFPIDILITDDDSLQLHGPLWGLLSVYLKYPDEDLLVLACDMPLMETGLLQELLSLSEQRTSYEAFIYTNDGEPEPLSGIYKAKGLASIYKLYRSNQLQKHSMKYMLEHISTSFTPLPDDKKNCFRNFNTQAELNRL